MKSNTELSSIVRKRTLGLIFVLGSVSLAFAQEKVNVSGTIADTQNRAVPYASVTFTHISNKLYSDAALTDEKGNYKLLLVPGQYIVSIEAIDYKKSTATRDITNGGNIGIITIQKESSATLTPTQEIQGVVIKATASKPYKVELDKKTYDPSQDVISKGGNLQDVLTNVPSVSVDTDGTVSMRGNSNVKFLINGKPSSLLGIDDGADALKSIPADQIERIEVITNPSSKFEASGTAGILNIILKKNKGRGFNGTVEGTLGYLPTTRLNTNLSWRKGPWTYYLNGGGNYDRRKNTRENSTQYFDDNGNTTSLLNQTNKNKNEGKSYNVSSGFTVDLSENTSLNLGGMLRYRSSEGTDAVNYLTTLLPQQKIFSSNRLSTSSGNATSWQGDFGIDHKFNKKGHNLSGSISLQQNRNNDDNNIEQTEIGAFDSRNIVDQLTTNKTLIVKTDYELPIGENSSFEAGYRLDRNDNDYRYDVMTSKDDIHFTPNVDFTSTTQYKEMFNAVYAQFRSKISRFGYQLGLRTENSRVDVDFYSLKNGAEEPIRKNYTGFFPSVFLSYDLDNDKNNQLLLNYSRRINRPRSWFLVPFNSFNLNDDRNIFSGNPDLNPEYVNSFELGYAIQKKKFTINPTLYFRKSQDETQMIVIRDLDDPTRLKTKPYNVGSESQMGLDLNATADLLPWWKIMANLDLFRYSSEGEFFNPDLMTKPFSVEGSGFSARTRLSNTFKIDKTLNVQLQGFFRGGEKTISSERKPMYGLNLGATKTIWKGNGTISFNIQDIFNTRAMKQYTFGPNFTRYQYMQWQPRQFSLSLSYRFRQGEKIEQPKRKKDNNSNFNGDDDQQPM